MRGLYGGASQLFWPGFMSYAQKDKHYEVYFLQLEGWLGRFQRAIVHLPLPDHYPFFFLMRLGGAGGTRIVSPLKV